MIVKRPAARKLSLCELQSFVLSSIDMKNPKSNAALGFLEMSQLSGSVNLYQKHRNKNSAILRTNLASGFSMSMNNNNNILSDVEEKDYINDNFNNTSLDKNL